MHYGFVLVVFLTAIVTVDGTNCVSSCEGMDDGDYQSCLGCKVYITCSNDTSHDNRSCPADLVWDDVTKRCELTSSTCPEAVADKKAETGQDFVKAEESALKRLLEKLETLLAGTCVSSCQGIADGDYQSCNGCNVYVTCSNELIYDNRPCPADLVWDDNKKRCEWTSGTCSSQQSTGTCVSSCQGIADGDYQSCNGCNVYVTCSNELIYDNRPCPADLVWDDNKKRCEWTSDTCSGPQSTGTCVSSCQGIADGDYQSCNGCNVYVTCSNELIYDNRPCPADLVWDDNKKRCEWTSDTCSGPQSTGTCVSSCQGIADGDYQSCNGCNVYVTCSNELIYDNRPCPADLVWDDNKKRCEWTSDTCSGQQSTGTCVSSCQGIADGDYQSCNGCNVYVTCSNELIYDNRPCPADLVWDDNKKRCEWTSDTCSPEAPSCNSNLQCSSWNFKFAVCPVPGSKLFSASLVKQDSKSKCELDETFGINEEELWVDNGCRGQFDVCACSEIREVDCNSWKFRYAACPIEDVEAVLNVKVNNKRSVSACEINSSFGFTGKSIWVDKGCRASFYVCI